MYLYFIVQIVFINKKAYHFVRGEDNFIISSEKIGGFTMPAGSESEGYERYTCVRKDADKESAILTKFFSQQEVGDLRTILYHKGESKFRREDKGDILDWSKAEDAEIMQYVVSRLLKDYCDVLQDFFDAYRKKIGKGINFIKVHHKEKAYRIHFDHFQKVLNKEKTLSEVVQKNAYLNEDEKNQWEQCKKDEIDDDTIQKIKLMLPSELHDKL